MSLYTPSNRLVEKLRTLFQRRVGDGQLAYLGNGAGVTAVPGKPGYRYARFPDGKDVNGFALYSAPFLVRAASAAFMDYEGAAVYVAYRHNGELEIVGGSYREMDKAGVNTAVLNPLNPQSKWVYLWQLTIGLCSAVATQVNSSFRVTVKKFRHFTGNVFQVFEITDAASKIDLSAYVPATDMHCLAAVWVDTFTNLPEVTTSTPQSLFTPLDETDIQECVPDRPPDGVSLKMFYLANNQGTIVQQASEDHDVRQFLNMPNVWGFPTTLTTRERVRPGYTLLVPPYTASGSGALTVEAGGAKIEVGNTDGTFAANSDAIVPTQKAIKTYVDAGGGGMTSFDAAADTGTPATIGDGDTVTIAGSATIDTVISGNTVTIAVQANSITATEIAANAIGSSELADNAVDTAAIADEAVTIAKIADGTANKFLGWDGTGEAVEKLIVDADVPDALTINGGTIENTPIGASTPNAGYFSDLRVKVGAFLGRLTHAITAARTWTFPDATGTVLLEDNTANVTNKTLISPVINTGVSGTAIVDDATFASPSSTKVPTTNAVKGYVDQAILGLSAKADVRLATAAALATNIYNNGASGVGATLTGFATGVLTIDGVTVALNDRLLIKNEVTGANNGIYKCTVAGAIGVAYVLTRATDADTDAELRGGWMVVAEGTVNAAQAFVNTNVSAITFGSTAITFGEFSAGVLSATLPIIRTGNTLSLDTTLPIVQINDTNGNELIKFVTTPSAVNELTVANAAAGGNPSITASGGDTDVGVKILPKGAGGVGIGGNAAPGLIFDVDNTNSLLSRIAPIITTTERNALVVIPGTGLLYNSDIARYQYYDAGSTLYRTLIQDDDFSPRVMNTFRLSGTTTNNAVEEQAGAASINLVSWFGNAIIVYRDGETSPSMLAPSNAGSISFPVSQTISSTTANGSANVTVANTRLLSPGMTVTGTGISGGTTISSITSDTVYVLSANATAGGTNTLTYAIPASKTFDVFGYASGTQLKLGVRLFTNDTTRAAALSVANSIPYLGTGISAYGRWMYLGTARTNGSSQIEDTGTGTPHRYIWNLYNPVLRYMRVFDATNSWGYTSTTIRQANASAANQIEIVCGLASMHAIQLKITAYNSTANAAVGVGENSTTVFSTQNIGMDAQPAGFLTAGYGSQPAVGYSFFSWNEKGIAGNTFLGDNNTTFMQSGMEAWYMM